MAAWSQTDLYSNVSVKAELDGNGTAINGTAYLMTQVGPGTTTANQIASADFAVTALPFGPDLTTLFTGLTLGPGTYYLIITASGGWMGNFRRFCGDHHGTGSRAGRWQLHHVPQ